MRYTWLSRCALATGLLCLCAAWSAAQETEAAKIAHIRLSGFQDESPTLADPLLGSSGQNFKSRLERIAKAAGDKDVAALYVQLDGLEVGFAQMQELRQAIAKFRKSGKKAYAYLEEGAAKDYLVGSECDIVIMPQSGWLLVVGLRAEITFFKNLLELLGIQADFLQMGVFKFAAEPFIRSDMSKEAREQYNKVIDDWFTTSYVSSISSSRKRAGQDKLTPEHVTKLIDEGPFTARQAVKEGLVDKVAYPQDVEEMIRKDLDSPRLKVVKEYGVEKKDVDLSNPFAIFRLLMPPKTSGGTKPNRIALIYAVGAITTGKGGKTPFAGNVVGSTTMIDAIREADKDPKVKAIVLRVDSPGGSALASDLIWHELKKCKKPVIASMGDTAASGGYYISMAARKIWADPGTLTGSIGVVSGKLALTGLYKKVGITTEVIARGKNSGIMSSSDPWTATERKSMEAMMQEVYDDFVTKALAGRVAAGKAMDRKTLIGFAEGRIWTGKQAHDNGLVDALGSLEDAIADAKVIAGLSADTEVDYVILPKPRSFLDVLLEGESPFGFSLESEVLARLPELRSQMTPLAGLLQLRREPVLLMMPMGVQVK